MIGFRIGFGAAALLLSAHLAVAQQTTRQGRMTGDTAMMNQHMRSMDSVNTRLDSLVTQMNAASGDQKMNAMAEILTTLVSERRMMRQHMGQMHRGMRGNMSRKSMQGRRNMRRPMGSDSAARDSSRTGH